MGTPPHGRSDSISARRGPSSSKSTMPGPIASVGTYLVNARTAAPLLGVAAAKLADDVGWGYFALSEEHEQVVQQVGALTGEG